MAAGESSSRPPATLTAPSVARTQNTQGLLQSPFQAGLELHSSGLLTLIDSCVFMLCCCAAWGKRPHSCSVASWITWQTDLTNVNAPLKKINKTQTNPIGAAFRFRNRNHVILSQAFSQTVRLFARLQRQGSGVKLHPANRSARLGCSCNRTPGREGCYCSRWKRFLRLVPAWDLFILCRLFVKHVINQSGQTTFMITDVNLFLIIDMSYFFLWFAYCIHILNTDQGAKECIWLPLLPSHHPTWHRYTNHVFDIWTFTSAASRSSLL